MIVGANSLSIIFVHGIDPNGRRSKSHAEDTWTHQNGTFWPQLLLPQLLPSARIILFEYNACFLGSQVTRTLHDLQKSLLDNIVELRQKEEEVHRPMVFIAHSLGEIYVKTALEEAKHDPQYRCLTASTYGIICFATPREGSNTDIVEIAARICSVMTDKSRDHLDAILDKRVLLHDYSTGLANLRDHQHNLEVLAFYERRKIEYKDWVETKNGNRKEQSIRGILVGRRIAIFIALLM